MLTDEQVQQLRQRIMIRQRASRKLYADLQHAKCMPLTALAAHADTHTYQEILTWLDELEHTP